jgi:hypothetical protein
MRVALATHSAWSPDLASARLSYEVAAEHATARVPIFAPGTRVGQMRAELVGKRSDSATHAVVCDEGSFRGIVRIEDLLAAREDAIAGGEAGGTSRGPAGSRQRRTAWPSSG